MRKSSEDFAYDTRFDSKVAIAKVNDTSSSDEKFEGQR